MKNRNLIPKINGNTTWTNEKCEINLPIPYEGECSFSSQFSLQKVKKDFSGVILSFEDDELLSEEGYLLEIQPDRINIRSRTEAGKYYGMQTLAFLIEQEKGSLTCGKIEDAPKFGYRGFMIDVSRHFFTVEEVKKIINQCAKYKLNKFHWHLSDDQGFRIESKKFPELIQIGSIRKEDDGAITKGFYTQKEIRDIISYSAERQIEVIPEIDMPGHTSAMIASYPELSCSGKAAEVKNKGGIYTQILCAGNEKTMRFIYELLDEIVPLFPGRYFHIGGDEAPKREWKTCKHCQQLIQHKHLCGEEELQAYFTTKIAHYLQQKGKTVIGWNDILMSGKTENMVAQYWNEPGQGYSYEEAKKGQKFIFSNSNVCYMDYPYCMVTLKGTYSFEPNIQGNTDIPTAQILGLEAPVWTEYIETEEKLEKQIFPRLQALAENAWSNEKDYEDFLRRVKLQEKNLMASGIGYTPVEAAAICGEEGMQMIKMWINNWINQTLAGGVELPPEMIRENIESTVQMIESCMQYAYTKEETECVIHYLVEQLEPKMQRL